MLPGSPGSPYYFRERKWLRGLKPQLIAPPLESLVGTYTWLDTGLYELVGPKLDHILVLHIGSPNVVTGLVSVVGRIGGFASGGALVAAKRMNDENGIEYWQLQVAEDKEEGEISLIDGPGGRSWRLYAGVHEDDNGSPFIEIQEVNGTQYAFGKRQTNDNTPLELTDAEKERLNFLPVNRASLGRREYQEVKRGTFVEDENIGDEHHDSKQYGSPWYEYDEELYRGFDPIETVPPLETLIGRYAWADTGRARSHGPRLKEGITLEVKDSKCEATGTNVGGYIGKLYLGGTILGAKKRKDSRGIEYWELDVTGEVMKGVEYDSDSERRHGHGTYWHVYVSKILDDNGHHFLDVSTLYFSECRPHDSYGYGKRRIPGIKATGFSESEKERINFITNEEKDAQEQEKRIEEERKRNEEAEKKQDAEKRERDAISKNAPEVKREPSPPQTQQRTNTVQPPSHNKASLSRQDSRIASSSSPVELRVQVLKRENSLQVRETSTAGNNNSNGDQVPSGQGQSKSARKRANKRKREEEARQQQQQTTAPGIVRYGDAASSGSLTFGNVPYPVDQHPSIKTEPIEADSIKAEPMEIDMVWEGTSSQQEGNRSQKRGHSDDESNFKRIKREHQ